MVVYPVEKIVAKCRKKLTLIKNPVIICKLCCEADLQKRVDSAASAMCFSGSKAAFKNFQNSPKNFKKSLDKENGL